MGGGYPFWHSDLHLGPMSNQKGALVGIGGGYRVGIRGGRRVLAYVRGGVRPPLTSLLTGRKIQTFIDQLPANSQKCTSDSKHTSTFVINPH